MAHKTGEHKRIAQRAEEGDFSWMVEPLDFLLLKELPDVGTNIGGMYEIGETVAGLNKKFPLVSSGILSGRMRAMSLVGMTKKVKVVGGGRDFAWQRTDYGKERLEEWLNSQQHQDQ